MLQSYIESATAFSDVCMCPCYIRTNILLLGGTGTRVSLSNSYQNTWQIPVFMFTFYICFVSKETEFCMKCYV